MKSNFKLSAILMCLALAGCMETSQELTKNDSSESLSASDEYNPNARAGGGGTTGQIYLSVTVDSVSGQMIASDGGGAYTNGIKGVSAQFQSPDGSLSFTMSPPRKGVGRKLTFPLRNPDYAINLNGYPSYLVNVLAPEDTPNQKKIQDMTILASQEMAMRVWGSNSSSVQFRLLYSLGSGLGYVNDKVLVTRTASDSWTVESKLNAAQATLTGPVNNDRKGEYSVPFKFIVKKIP